MMCLINCFSKKLMMKNNRIGMSNNKMIFIFCSKYLFCDVNIVIIVKFKNIIWVELKNGMSLFLRVLVFFILFIMNFVVCVSINGKMIMIIIFFIKIEIVIVFMILVNKNK